MILSKSSSRLVLCESARIADRHPGVIVRSFRLDLERCLCLPVPLECERKEDERPRVVLRLNLFRTGSSLGASGTVGSIDGSGC